MEREDGASLQAVAGPVGDDAGCGDLRRRYEEHEASGGSLIEDRRRVGEGSCLPHRSGWRRVGRRTAGVQMKGLFLDAVDDLADVFRRVLHPDDPPMTVNEQLE